MSKKKKSKKEPTEVDFSIVMVGPKLRQRVLDEFDLHPRDVNYMGRVVSAVIHAASSAQAASRQSREENPFNATRLAGGDWGASEIDLATLISLPDSKQLQAEVRLRNGKASCMGPVGIALLKDFANKAKELVLADARAASTG